MATTRVAPGLRPYRSPTIGCRRTKTARHPPLRATCAALSSVGIPVNGESRVRLPIVPLCLLCTPTPLSHPPLASHRNKPPKLTSCARVASDRCPSPRPDADRREELVCPNRSSPSSTAEHRCVDQPLQPSSESSFTATSFFSTSWCSPTPHLASLTA
jgi:hypothetical protein